MQPAMIPAELLDERRRLGHDKLDEVWDGVIHMVPPPTTMHQRVERDLLLVLLSIARARGQEAFENAGLHDPGKPGYKDYREPDVAVVDRRYLSGRGIEGRAELVVEVVSPNDESRDKLPFYARVGVREIWLVDARQHTVEVFTVRDGEAVAVAPIGGVIHAPSLGLELEVIGTDLHIRDGATAYTVDIRDVY